MNRLLSRTLLACISVVPLAAADWPQFRGPARDGVAKEKNLLQSWPEAGPPLAWTGKGLGDGFSSVTLAGDRIYTLGNKNNKTNLVAVNRKTGAVLWATPLGEAGGSLGCTPTTDGDLIFALGQMGDLACINKAGKPVWSHNLLKEFGGQKGGWNYCESPLVDGDKVLVTPGGKDATMLALNKKTGAVVWKCPIPTKNKEAGYSSIVTAEVGGVKQYVQLFNGGLVGVSTGGKLLWKHEKLGENTANVPTPIVSGEYVFSSIGYGRGAALMKLKADGDGVTAEEVYYQRELTNKHGGVIRVGDYVYGDTDDRGQPFCAEFKTGKVMWKREGRGKGHGSAAVTFADGRLYFHYDNGVVSLVDPSPEAYKEVGSFEVPKKSGPLWAHPVVCDGLLYVRSGDNLYCYDVRAKR